jgi:hypothetical protein
VRQEAICHYHFMLRCDMLRIGGAVLLIAALTAWPLRAGTVWHVPGDFKTIQAALEGAGSNDTILVAPGWYYENVDFAGRDVQLQAVNPSTSLVDPLDPLVASIIDGSQPADPNTASVVRMAGGESAACLLDGFTLVNGTGVLQPSGYTVGGGVFGGGSYATITRCTVRGNTARFGGGLELCAGTISNCNIVENWTSFPGSNHGGAGLEGCSGTISGCLIARNQADEGGGLHTCNYALILNCDIRDNTATWSGGGTMWCDYSTFVNCNFSGNQASTSGEGAGGAVFSQIGTYINCTFATNSSLMGGAIYAWQDFAPTMHNCILWGNQAPTGSQIALNAGDTPCTLAIDYSDLQGGQAGVWLGNASLCQVQWGAGMLVADPLFASPASGNFRLQPKSPCINAGGNTYASAGSDLDGRPRIAGGTVDMGAYEFQPGVSGLFIAWLQQYGLPTDGSADFTDPDHDGMNNWQEWRCGTDPTNAASVLRMVFSTPAGNNVNVTWQSVAGVTYVLQCSTNLAGAPPFLSLATNLAGQAGTTTFTHTNAAVAKAAFYRVGVQ